MLYCAHLSGAVVSLLAWAFGQKGGEIYEYLVSQRFSQHLRYLRHWHSTQLNMLIAYSISSLRNFSLRLWSFIDISTHVWPGRGCHCHPIYCYIRPEMAPLDWLWEHHARNFERNEEKGSVSTSPHLYPQFSPISVPPLFLPSFLLSTLIGHLASLVTPFSKTRKKLFFNR